MKQRRNPWALLLAVCFALPLSLVSPNASFGQTGSFSLPDIPVLTIEREQLFSSTLFGQRLSGEIAALGRRLNTENRRIEGELEAEESELIGLRETMSAEEFRDLADVFDTKVTTARAEQDEKARALALTNEQAQRGFLIAIAPVMERLMSEKGASVILDRRSVFVSADASDVTIEAVERIDAALGEGIPLIDVLPKVNVSAPQQDPIDPDPSVSTPQPEQ